MVLEYRIALLFFTILFAAGNAVQTGAVTIAENGQAKAVIVIDANGPEPERYAAAELANFLGQVSGAKFDIVQQAQKGNPRLFVGPKAARLTDANFSTDGLGDEGIVIRTIGDDLILAGGYRRGTLYAVYTFLEDNVGCHWWSSKVSAIPSKPTLEFDKLDVRYVPRIEYREPFWYDAFDGDWSARNKCNGHHHRLEEKHGGKRTYCGHHVHTFDLLIPWKKYFNDHPEWFSEINGKRKKRSQLCLTNEDMRKELVKNLKARLRKNPDASIVSVSQNDRQKNCQCSKCKAVDEKEGSPAGTLLHFVNAVAADIEQEFPDVAISTLAYQYTRKPPKYVKPRHNVIVRLCSIECSFSTPLSKQRNEAFSDDVKGWSKICNRLYIWDYVTNFRYYWIPHPNLRLLAPNIKFFAAYNVRGVLEQGAYRTSAEMAELRAWVLAKLLWNPSLDGEKLIDEFLEGYYGPASPHIKAYLNLTHDTVESRGDYLGCYSRPNAKFLSFYVLSKGMSYLKAAEEAVKNNPELRYRVQVAQLPVMSVFILRWDELREKAQETGADWPMPASAQQTFEQFVEIAKKKGITRLSESQEGYDALEKEAKKAKK